MVACLQIKIYFVFFFINKIRGIGYFKDLYNASEEAFRVL